MTAVSTSTSACSTEPRQIPQSEDASCFSSEHEPSTPVSFSDVPAVTKSQRKPLIFEYYKDISVDETNKATKGVCTRCERTIHGKYGVTSNFVTHLKVWDCKLLLCRSYQLWLCCVGVCMFSMDVTHCSSADIVNGLDWNLKISICVWYTITAKSLLARCGIGSLLY